MFETIPLFIAFMPFIVIMVLANVAERNRAAGREPSLVTALTYMVPVGLYLALFGIGMLLQLVGAVATSNAVDFNEAVAASGLNAGALGTLLDSLPVVGFSLWFPSMLGIALLLPPVRRVAARAIPIDPANHIHAVSLSYISIVLINMLVTLAIGLDTLAETTADGAAAGVGGNIIIQLWTQQLLTAFLALIGVGWGVRRTLPDVLARLKLTRITGREFAIGLGLAVLLVPVVTVLEYLGSLVGLGNPDVEALTEALLGPLFTSIWGVLTLGLAAAIGEETLFRGALQPRFGRIFTSFIFALLHSNYGVSLAFIAVFALGYVLGWIRDRYSTTVAMVTHAAYNMILGLIAYLAATSGMF